MKKFIISIKSNLRKKERGQGTIPCLSCLIGAVLLKIFYFYYVTGMPISKFPYSFVTISFFALIFLLLHKRPLIYVPLVSALTILMYADILYFRYFNDFVSVNLVHQTAFVGSITDIIFSLIRITDLIIILDIVAYTYFIRNGGKLRFDFKKLKLAITSIALIGIMVGTSAAGYFTGIRKYEFVNFHTYDILGADLENSFLTDEDKDLIAAMMKEKSDAKNSEYFGIGKGKNVILIQMESIQSAVIGSLYNGQEIMPNLNSLIKKDSFYFENYYQQLGKGNTADAEFVSLNSLYPVMTGDSYTVFETNYFYGLPWILRQEGYSATSYHGYISSFWNRENVYPNVGFEKSYFEDDYVMGDKVAFGLDDYDFFDQTVDYLKDDKGLNFNFLITLSSHKPYKLDDDKSWLEIKEEDDNIFGNYVNSVHYFDNAFGEFIDKLKAEGIYEDSIIILYGDHYGIGIEDKKATESMENFLGHEYTYEEMFNIPLIIHIPGMGFSQNLDITGGQIDLLPTILEIMGIKNEYLTFGQNLFTAKEGFVASQSFLEIGSFIDNEIIFETARDGTFENAQAYCRNTHIPVSKENTRQKYEDAIKWINLSKKVTTSNALGEILGHEVPVAGQTAQAEDGPLSKLFDR